MSARFSYACKDYPGMEDCPGMVVAATEEEVWKLIELHAAHAHGEQPAEWTGADRAYLRTLIRTE